VRKEIEQLFVTLAAMTDKKVHIEGWEGPDAAEELVDEAARTYVHGARTH
jgi:inorganic pyrophosphatase